MTSRIAVQAMAVFVLLLGCDDHVPAGPDAGDHTPPSIATVQSRDINHVVVVFDERVSRETAENKFNYHFDHLLPGGPGPSPTPPDPYGERDSCNVCTAAMYPDNRTVALTTTILDPYLWTFSVHGVADVHGNVITNSQRVIFEGTDGPDLTPPEIVLQIPAPDATSASTGGFVLVGFSEEVDWGSFVHGFHMTGDGTQLVSIRNEDLSHYVCDLNELKPNTDYTITLSGLTDLAGNLMPDAQWTFKTAAALDTIPPAVTSSRPANAEVNVDPNTFLTLRFSEPMDPYTLFLRPHVRADAVRWSDGGRRVTFETTWAPDWNYTIQVRPGDMRDVSGNRSTKLFTMTFSTGPSLPSSRFSGTIAGDPASNAATNAAGALVFAGPRSPQDIYTSVVTTVGSSGAYDFKNLPPATYFPFCVMDSNHDGVFQLDYGDAVGIYGITDWWSNQTPASVATAARPVTGVDFQIYDPTAVYGVLSYDPSLYTGLIRVGLFHTTNFDPVTSLPVVSSVAVRTGTWDYSVNSLDAGPIPDGDYYVAGWLDANTNDLFDPGIDPVGVYGGSTPVAIHVTHGADFSDVSFSLELSPPAAARAVRWPVTPSRSTRLKDLLAAIDRATAQPR